MKNVWLNGHACLRCGAGYYDGYMADRGLTQPCNRCGHVAPNNMSAVTFRKMIAAADFMGRTRDGRDRLRKEGIVK